MKKLFLYQNLNQKKQLILKIKIIYFLLSETSTLALENLPDRERFIIRNRYFAEARQTFASIGRELNLSKDRVRQLEARALESLREFLEPFLLERQITVK